jgi:hypothetical protein
LSLSWSIHIKGRLINKGKQSTEVGSYCKAWGFRPQYLSQHLRAAWHRRGLSYSLETSLAVEHNTSTAMGTLGAGTQDEKPRIGQWYPGADVLC